jgi:chromosome segregation and condensation protein ScpB
MIRIRAKISRIRNTGKTFKKCLLKLIIYVLNSKNLHNETISRNNLYEISRNFAKYTGIWKIYITKQFRERKYNEISRN